MSRFLAVDPGDVRIGLALSDPSGTIATPLATLEHESRVKDAKSILLVAREHGVTTIIVGVPYDIDGDPGPQARKSLRLVEVLSELGTIPVIAWDESGSTQAASRGTVRDADLDARAAAFILQDYLDAQAA